MRTPLQVLTDFIESEIGQYPYFSIDSIEETDNYEGETYFEVAISVTQPPNEGRPKTLFMKVDNETHYILIDMHEDTWEVVEGQWGESKYLWMALLSWEI
jgi:hypothetical protein